MIILSLFQIPDLAFAMAEDEPHLMEVSEGRRPTRGTKRGRGGSGVQASEDDLLASEVISVSSFWIFLPAASYSFNPAGRATGLRSCRSEQAPPCNPADHATGPRACRSEQASPGGGGT